MPTPRTDRCPTCVEHVVAPAHETRAGDELICRYQCPCGHQWNTRRLVDDDEPAATPDPVPLKHLLKGPNRP
jgi:hypothetical protein